MKTTIFIPEKINVGFQKRDDTYTKKLAYIIYFDQKGVLRKESSWQSWRDKNIDSIIFSNTPTSGFVLNKKAGGYDTGWNHRQTYCRVYDPRDFEFEITIPNLLYILENTNSIKGKGLEGEFVYGWDGKDLVLIPVDSPDYKEISEFNAILHSNNYVKAKDLILGATYRTKDNQEYIYMGRFDYWDTISERIEKENPSRNFWNRYTYTYISHDINKGKYHYFIPKGKDINSYYTLKLKSLGDKFIECVSFECVENYADLFDKLECTTDYSPYDKIKDEYVSYNFDEFQQKVKDSQWYCNVYNYNKQKVEIRKQKDVPDMFCCSITDNYSKNTETYTIDELFNMLQPLYKNEYLVNGKLYRRIY